MRKETKKQDAIIKEQDGRLVLEVHLSRKLRKEMEDLAEKTAGTIPAL